MFDGPVNVRVLKTGTNGVRRQPTTAFFEELTCLYGFRRCEVLRGLQLSLIEKSPPRFAHEPRGERHFI
jgi:hypothetical protein